MAGREPRRAEARHRAEPQRHHRHVAEGRGEILVAHARVAELTRQVGTPRRLDGLDRAAAARALDDADDRQAQLVGHALGQDRLHVDGGVGRPAAQGEVVAQHDDRPAVDRGATHDAIGRRELGQLVVGVVFGLAGDGADLVEAAFVDQPVDALAHRQPAAVVLALDLVGPAHLARHAFARAQFVEFRLPAHVLVPGLRFPPDIRCSGGG